MLSEETSTFAYVRDLSNAVRGGRIPRWTLSITRWLRLVGVARIGGGGGRLRVCDIMHDRGDLPARFVARIVRKLDLRRRWRAQVLHCDNTTEGERVRAALLQQLPDVDVGAVLDAGSAIGAHGGPGAVVIALMPDPRPIHPSDAPC